MAKKQRVREHWKDDPEEHDFPAAADYLGLLFGAAEVASIMAALRSAEVISCKVKDVLRASRLELLPSSDPEVAKDLEKVAVGERLSPVLLVRGRGAAAVPLIVADGYHRVCASYHISEDTEIRCQIVDGP